MNHIVITGASSPLGIALCDHLVSTFHPKQLTIVARRTDLLQKIKCKYSSPSIVEALSLDLLKQEDLTKLCSYLDHQAPDLIINSAGIGLYGNALDHPIQEQINILELNSRALLQISLHGAKALLKHHRKGIILNISSAADALIYPTFSVYAASKSFVTSFSQSFDQEMKPYGIRILTSAPGPISTDFKQHASKGYALHQAANALSPERAARVIVWQLLKLKPYHVFPWKTRYGRAFLNSCIPKRWRYLLLKKFLKNDYKIKDLNTIFSDQDT